MKSGVVYSTAGPLTASMSVLAERRQKKKWSVDPRGTNWANDESKFGTKMMKKMGWSEGKGLGINEDGVTQHIKVKAKNDNRGVGCSVKEEQNWVAHQDDFASLLAQLNDHHPDNKEEKAPQKEVASLEKKSKSQKRVHYQKFTRGKDLSNYKEKDLAAIFGMPVSRSAPPTPINLSDAELSGDDASSGKEKKRKTKSKNSQSNPESLNHVTSALSVQEYFAQRMLQKVNSETDLKGLEKKQKKKRKRQSSVERTIAKVTSSDAEELTKSKNTEEASSVTKPLKKRKKSKKTVREKEKI